jgi:hypothetical protein
MELLDQQIQREISESQECCRVEARQMPRLALYQVAYVSAALLLGVALGTYLGLPPTPPLATPVASEFPLLPLISAFSLAATNLAPTIFYNQLFYIGIGNKPGAEFILPPSIVNILCDAHDASLDLREYIQERIIDEDIGWWVTTNKSDDKGIGALRHSHFWGISYKYTGQIYRRGTGLNSNAEIGFNRASDDIFWSWMRDLVTHLKKNSRNLYNATWTPADNMLIAQGNMSRWVLRESLPPKMPPGITYILWHYGFWVTHHRDDHFSSSCQILRNCSSRTAFPHPSCSRHDSLEDTIKHLESWAQDARRRDLSKEDILGSIKWPHVLDLPRIVAQLIDYEEELIRLAESMQSMPVMTKFSRKAWKKWRRRPFYDIINLWPEKYEPEDPSDTIVALKELVDTRLRRMLHDVSQGLRLMQNICDDFNALTDFIDSLHSPTNWIINEDGPFVELLQMPPPREQSTYLADLTMELSTRLKKTEEFWSLWYWWEHNNVRQWKSRIYDWW